MRIAAFLFFGALAAAALIWMPGPSRALPASMVISLDLRRLQLACDPFIGEHDFSSFCRRPKPAPGAEPASMKRRVISAQWSEVPGDVPGLLRFEIRANAFCHQMVRSIVGTLVDVGLGKLHAGDITAILRTKSRLAAGSVAPPHGLTLWQVGYPD